MSLITPHLCLSLSLFLFLLFELGGLLCAFVFMWVWPCEDILLDGLGILYVQGKVHVELELLVQSSTITL